MTTSRWVRPGARAITSWRFSRAIRELKLALIDVQSNLSPDAKAFAERTIADLRSEKSPHSNCVRSFLRLYLRDRPRAEAIFQAAMEYLESLDTPNAAGA
jgi:hypothetical protein